MCMCVCVCMHAYMLSCFSCVLLFAILWTVAYQAPLPWDFPGKNTGVGCCALLQKIFPIQGLNPHLLHCRQILHCSGTGEALCICIYAYNWNTVVQLLSHIQLFRHTGLLPVQLIRQWYFPGKNTGVGSHSLF